MENKCAYVTTINMIKHSHWRLKIPNDPNIYDDYPNLARTIEQEDGVMYKEVEKEIREYASRTGLHLNEQV